MNPLIINLLLALFELLGRALPPILDALHRTGELTQAEWTAYKERMTTAVQAPHWQPTTEVEP